MSLAPTRKPTIVYQFPVYMDCPATIIALPLNSKEQLEMTDYRNAFSPILGASFLVPRILAIQVNNVTIMNDLVLQTIDLLSGLKRTVEHRLISILCASFQKENITYL